jgi:hypothetical protein
MIATTTALTIAAVASVAGAGIAAYGAIQQGQAAKKMGDYNAKIAANNAIIQQNNAKAAQQQASLEADRKRRIGKIIAGKQRAAATKSGVTFSGSVEDVMIDSSVNVEIDALTELYKGNLSSQDYINRSASSLAEGELSKMQGRAARTSSYYSAAGSILSGAGSAAGYYGMSKSPQFAG